MSIYIAAHHKIRNFFEDLLFPFYYLSVADYFVLGLFTFLEFGFFILLIFLLL